MYCIFITAVLLCAGCASKSREETSSETGSMTEAKTEEPVYIQVFAPEDVEVVPEIVKYDYESACEKGEICRLRGMLPGMAEGTWYIIMADGVEYYYAGYDESPDRTELLGYAIVSDKYSLANGISVGMTQNEVIELYPAMAILDMEGNTLNEVVGHMGWNKWGILQRQPSYPCKQRFRR